MNTKCGCLHCKHFSLSVLRKRLVFRAGIHKMLIRIANREDSDQTAFLTAYVEEV